MPRDQLRHGNRRLHRLRFGANAWYRLTNGPSNGLLEVRNGTVRQIGIADRQLTVDRASTRSFLRSFG